MHMIRCDFQEGMIPFWETFLRDIILSGNVVPSSKYHWGVEGAGAELSFALTEKHPTILLGFYMVRMLRRNTDNILQSNYLSLQPLSTLLENSEN